MPSIIMIIIVVLNVAMLSIVMYNVFVLSTVVMKCHYTEFSIVGSLSSVSLF